MAKAILINIDMNVDADYSSIRSHGTNEILRIHGPMTYTYHLTYVSSEPLNTFDFPVEIDTENVTRNFVTSPTPANPNCKILKATVTKIEKPKRVVNNSIGQLEVED